ncbi:MAG: GMC family oxidoreductase N-terminal domain-containing protein [Actinomycetota bacterium]
MEVGIYLPGLVTFCAALLPPEAGGPDPHALAADVGRFVGALPRPMREATRAGFLAFAGAAQIMARRRLEGLSIEKRERVLARLSHHRHATDLVAQLKSLVLLVAGTNAAAPELLRRSQVNEPARADAEMNVTPATEWPAYTRCDAIVIGSGAGGAIAARTLARAGLDVVIVEEGRHFSVQEFRTQHPLERFANLYRDAGGTVALGRPPVLLPIGRGVGGTTLVNSGTCYRPPERVLLQWRDAAGIEAADPSHFATYLDEIEDTLQVAPQPLDVIGRNAHLALEGAGALGWDAAPLRRNAPGCAGSCQCAIGCPRNAKFGVHMNALPQACAAGARIVSEARVFRIAHERDRVTGISIRTAGAEIEIRAPKVFIAAGATETPPLLRRSGLGRHPQLGRNLALHPAVSIAGRFDEKVTAWEGVLQSVGVEEFHESEGILIEATSTPPGMGSFALPGQGRELMHELENADHLAMVGAMVADSPSGRVHGRRRALITYQLSETDATRLKRAIEVLARLLFAAGAREVLTGLARGPRATSIDEIRATLAGLDRRQLHLAAFHPTGTARAGKDPESYPVDPTGRLRGSNGIWVTDASIVPSSPQVNPQVTIMALALAVSTEATGA